MPLLAPEYALKNKINEIKKRLIQSSQSQKTPMSQNPLLQVSTTDEQSVSDIVIINQYMNTILSALEKKSIRTEEELDEFSKNLALDLNTTDEELALMLVGLIQLAYQLKTKAQVVCSRNGIDYPSDDSEKLISIQFDVCDTEDLKNKLEFSIQDLAEIRFLATLENAPIEHLETPDLFSFVPYLRLIKVPDLVLKQIETEMHQYPEQAIKLLDELTVSLDGMIDENKYAKTIQTQIEFNEQLQALKKVAEEAVSFCTQRNKFVKESLAKALINHPQVDTIVKQVKELQELIDNALLILQKYNDLITYVNTLHTSLYSTPLKTDEPSKPNVTSTMPLGRIDIIQALIKNFAEHMKPFQERIGEEVSEFGLGDFINDWENQQRPSDALIDSLSYTMNATQLSGKIIEEMNTFHENMVVLDQLLKSTNSTPRYRFFNTPPATTPSQDAAQLPTKPSL